MDKPAKKNIELLTKDGFLKVLKKVSKKLPKNSNNASKKKRNE
ncbi:MAG: hypothetical protein V4702_00710 [Patescibacteria group bacterium]